MLHCGPLKTHKTLVHNRISNTSTASYKRRRERWHTSDSHTGLWRHLVEAAAEVHVIKWQSDNNSKRFSSNQRPFLACTRTKPFAASERICLSSSCVKLNYLGGHENNNNSTYVWDLRAWSVHDEKQQSSWRDGAKRKERQQQCRDEGTRPAMIPSPNFWNNFSIKKDLWICNPLFSATLFRVEELGPLFECRLTLLRNRQANTRLAALAR